MPRFSSQGAPHPFLRLLTYYVSMPEEGCWRTSLRLSKRGYPRMSLRGKAVHASRVVLAMKLGRALLPGEVARHTCDTPWCMRPEHIVPGTQADNNRDRDERARVARCAATGRHAPC